MQAVLGRYEFPVGKERMELWGGDPLVGGRAGLGWAGRGCRPACARALLPGGRSPWAPGPWYPHAHRHLSPQPPHPTPPHSSTGSVCRHHGHRRLLGDRGGHQGALLCSLPAVMLPLSCCLLSCCLCHAAFCQLPFVLLPFVSCLLSCCLLYCCRRCTFALCLLSCCRCRCRCNTAAAHAAGPSTPFSPTHAHRHC